MDNSIDTDNPPKIIKKQLSSNIMNMRFMKRKEEAEIREKQENEFAKEIQAAHWVDKDKEVKGLLFDDNFAFSRVTGRRSFGRFNPSIERLYKDQKREEIKRISGKQEEEKKIQNPTNKIKTNKEMELEENVTVSAEEMAKYSKQNNSKLIRKDNFNSTSSSSGHGKKRENKKNETNLDNNYSNKKPRINNRF